MASVVVGGLSRVTIVSGRSRVDLALPSDVPLADLLPTLLGFAGAGLADEAAGRGGWVLSRLSGEVLDSSRSAAQLGVRDGELLYFTPPDGTAPEIVFDDVVDAVATATKRRAGGWKASDTRLFSLVLGTMALLVGAVVDLYAGKPQILGSVIGLGVGVMLILVGTITSRALGDSRTGVVLGLLGLVYLAVGGLLLLAGDKSVAQLGPPHLLVAATLVVLGAVLAMAGVADSGQVFLGAASAAIALALGAGICQLFDRSAAQSAAIIVPLAFAALPMMPMFAYRTARLPIPSLPSGPEELRADAESVDRVRILSGADRAHDFMAGGLATIAVIAGVGAVVLTLGGGPPGLLLGAVLALVGLLRSRPFMRRAHRIPMLASGAVGLMVVGYGAFTTTQPVLRYGVVLGGALFVAVLSIGFGVSAAGSKASPIAGRTLDKIGRAHV